jgi:uncharacterized protein
VKTKQDYMIFDYHRVWQNEKADDINEKVDDNKAYLRNKQIPVNATYNPNNVLDSCYADKRNSVTINYNGDIYKCTARDFTPENRGGYLSDNGMLIWENDYLEQRMNAKFKNKPCLTCRLLPICNGGCTQHSL